MNRLVDLLFERRGMDMSAYLDMEKIEKATLDGMDDVVEALHTIHEDASNKTLVVAPDFDMDGIMSGVVLVAGLSELGFPVELFVPNPKEGYGITAAESRRLVAEHPNVGWVITCDMGISCVEGIRELRSLGVPTIITDHHKEPAKSARKYAMACVDPCGITETYPLPQICGAYVAWKVVAAYANKYGDEEVFDRINRLRVFAGIGTVSDLMPLVGENRRLVRDALGICRLSWANPDPWFVRNLPGGLAYVRAFEGLMYALKAFDDEHSFASQLAIDEKFLGFSLAPTFNAAKRMDVDMGHAFNIFFGDETARAKGMDVLMAANAARKELVKRILTEIINADNPYSPIAYITDASSGILGLLASRLIEMSGMPTLVLHQNDDGTLSGSGRSPAWYPFIDRAAAHLGVDAAGHNGAFGVRFKSLDDLADKAWKILEDAHEVFDALEVDEGITYDIFIDSAGKGDIGYDISTLTEFITDMQTFKPFGVAWPEPMVRAHARAGEFTASTMGSMGQHLRIALPKGLSFISWNNGDMAQTLNGHDVVVEGHLSINEFMGNMSLQLIGNVEGHV